MAQILKDEIRNKILTAAEIMFATRGYKQAAMSAIAREAGVATGNIYKYFASKDDLFHSIITPDFLAEFLDLTEKRLDALIRPGGLDSSKSMTRGEAGKLLQFWVRNRLKVIIVLSRAQGSRQEAFFHDYVQTMFDKSLMHLRKKHPEVGKEKTFLFIFRNRLSDTVRGLVDILDGFETEEEIVKAVAASWTYHHAGIAALLAWFKIEQ